MDEKNYHKYGVRRMTIALQNKGYIINHKRVERIMKLNGIAGKTPKKKYHSFKGEVGRIAPNVINRDFKTERPYEKIGTDVTQFITKHGKLYLSHMIDFHTREIELIPKTCTYCKLILMQEVSDERQKEKEQAVER